MIKDLIIFAMANPIPEIMPKEAKKGGALLVQAKRITKDMKVRAAEALANLVKNPTVNKIIPNAFDEGVTDTVAEAVSGCYT